jgi:hypothetical protein
MALFRQASVTKAAKDVQPQLTSFLLMFFFKLYSLPFMILLSLKFYEIKEEGDLLTRGLPRVGSVYGVPSAILGELFSNGPLPCIPGVGGPDESAQIPDGVLLLQNSHHDRARDHEFDQTFKKGLVAMYSVKPAGRLRGQSLGLQGTKAKAFLSNPFKNLSRHSTGHRIWLYDQQGSFPIRSASR